MRLLFHLKYWDIICCSPCQMQCKCTLPFQKEPVRYYYMMSYEYLNVEYRDLLKGCCAIDISYAMLLYNLLHWIHPVFLINNSSLLIYASTNTGTTIRLLYSSAKGYVSWEFSIYQCSPLVICYCISPSFINVLE